MTADVTQDRRVTEPGLGSSDSAFVDGSRLFWALPSPVHERSGFGPPHPTGYKLMRCLPHNNVTAQSRVSRHPAHDAHRNVPIRKPHTSLAAVKAATRRLRRWPAASPDGGCVWRSGLPSERRSHCERSALHDSDQGQPPWQPQPHTSPGGAQRNPGTVL